MKVHTVQTGVRERRERQGHQTSTHQTWHEIEAAVDGVDGWLTEDVQGGEREGQPVEIRRKADRTAGQAVG
jgi:hypothetical protein